MSHESPDFQEEWAEKAGLRSWPSDFCESPDPHLLSLHELFGDDVDTMMPSHRAKRNKI